MRTKNPTLGVVLAIFSAMLFGLNASSTKITILAGFTPEQLVLFRSVITTVVSGTILLFTNRKAFAIKKSEWKFLITLGIVGIACMQWSYSYSVSFLPVGIALLIQYSAIIMIPIVSYILFKKKPSNRIWGGIAVVVSGVLVVSQIWTGGLNGTGVVFAFSSAVFMTFYFILGEHSHLSREPISTLFYTMLFSSIFWLAVSPWWTFDWQMMSQTINLSGSLSDISLPAFALIIWIGIMGSFMPMILSYMALGHMNATVVSVIFTSEVVFAFIFGYLWLNESMTGTQLLGGLLVLAGITWTQMARSK